MAVTNTSILGKQAESNFFIAMQSIGYVVLVEPSRRRFPKSIRPATSLEEQDGIDFVITDKICDKIRVFFLQITISVDVLGRKSLRAKLRRSLNREVVLLWPDHSSRSFQELLSKAAQGDPKSLWRLKRHLEVRFEAHLGLREPSWRNYYLKRLGEHEQLYHPESLTMQMMTA